MTSTNDSTAGRTGRSTAPWLVPLLTAALTLAVYVATLTPEVDWSDAAELALQANQLGVTHPPGYPVHTFLGKLLALIIEEPALATNLLSALGASLAAGLLSLITLRLTDDWRASPLAGLFFAFVPQVWDLAVVTEVYAVSTAFFALALLLVLACDRSPRTALPILAALALALCLGSYLGNFLVIPGLVWLLWRGKRARFKRALLFLLIAAVAAGFLLSWSYFRSSALPPIGTRYLPDTPEGFVQYLSGEQYGAAEVHEFDFYYDRLTEHAEHFFGSFTWIGIALGLLGLFHQWRADRPVSAGLFLVFAANFLYFTGYAAIDYQTMVTVSYFIFSLWVAYGVSYLARLAGSLPAWLVRSGRILLPALGIFLALAAVAADHFGFGSPGFGLSQALGVAAGVALAAVGIALRRSGFVRWLGANGGAIGGVALSIVALAVVVHPQLEPRVARTKSEYVTTYVYYSFDEFPTGSLVVASWDKFTPLYYFQRAHGLRPDLTIIERTLGPSARPRTYRFGTIDDWRAFVSDSVDSRPVFVDDIDEALAGTLMFEPVPHGWYQVTAYPAANPD